MTHIIRRLLLLTLVLGLALATGSSAAGEPPQNRLERAEVRFLQGMIDHHMMALMMAGHCLGKSENEALRTLCQNVIDSQSPEILQMLEWLDTWYDVEYGRGMDEMVEAFMEGDFDALGMMGNGMGMMGGDGMGMMGDGDPMMMMGMMAGFNRLTGVDYDINWLEAMIDHHDDAIHMAERLLPRIVHEELGTLAQAIITAQSAEIEQMEALIVELSAAQ